MDENEVVNLSGNTSTGPIPGVQSLNQTIQEVAREQANNFAAAQVVQTTVTQAINNQTLTYNDIPMDNMQANVDEFKQQEASATTVSGNVSSTSLNSGDVTSNPVVNINNVTDTGVTNTNVTDTNVTANKDVVSNDKRPVSNIVEKEEANKFILNDKFIVNLEVLKTMVQNAKKAATCEQNSLLTQMFDITFDSDYLKFVSTDDDNVLIQKNTSIGFKDILHFNVSAEFFTNLVTKLTCETVEFSIDPDTRYITMITDDGSKLSVPETYERNTGSSFIIERESGKLQSGDIVIDINCDEFKQLIQKSKSFSADPSMFKYLSGVYCSDRIYSTDTESMFGLPNLPELKNYTFYLSEKFVKLFLSLNFDTQAQIILRSNGTNVSHVILRDSRMEIEGPCDLEDTSKYPIDTVRKIIEESFDTRFTIDKAKLLSVLRVAELFITPNTDKESCVFMPDINGSMLHINSVNKQARQSIPIQDLTADIRPFNLRVKSILEILTNCLSDSLTIEVDAKNYRNIRIVDKDFTLITSIVNLDMGF